MPQAFVYQGREHCTNIEVPSVPLASGTSRCGSRQRRVALRWRASASDSVGTSACFKLVVSYHCRHAPAKAKRKIQTCCWGRFATPLGLIHMRPFFGVQTFAKITTRTSLLTRTRGPGGVSPGRKHCWFSSYSLASITPSSLLSVSQALQILKYN